MIESDPRYRYAARQLRKLAMAAMTWMLTALLIGLNVEVRPSARFRRHWKKFTVTVRGTTPTRFGLPMPRATMYEA